jgi:hypothetical protein
VRRIMHHNLAGSCGSSPFAARSRPFCQSTSPPQTHDANISSPTPLGLVHCLLLHSLGQLLRGKPLLQTLWNDRSIRPRHPCPRSELHGLRWSSRPKTYWMRLWGICGYRSRVLPRLWNSIKAQLLEFDKSNQSDLQPHPKPVRYGGDGQPTQDGLCESLDLHQIHSAPQMQALDWVAKRSRFNYYLDVLLQY